MKLITSVSLLLCFFICQQVISAENCESAFNAESLIGLELVQETPTKLSIDTKPADGVSAQLSIDTKPANGVSAQLLRDTKPADGVSAQSSRGLELVKRAPANLSEDTKLLTNGVSTQSSRDTKLEVESNIIVPDTSIQILSVPVLSPRKVKNLYKSYRVSRVKKLDPTLDDVILQTVPLIKDTSNSFLYDIGELNGEKVYFRKITETAHLNELAVLQTFKELGIPILFEGVVKDAEGAFYMIYRFVEGGYVTQLAMSGINFTSVTYYIYRQIDELTNLFFRIGIYPKNIQLFLSKKGEVFIINPAEYEFTGKVIKESTMEAKEIHGEFEHIVKNLKRQWAAVSFLVQNGSEDNLEQLENDSALTQE